MAHGKQKTSGSGSGKERKETRSERRARLEAEQEARDYCFKILPLVGGVIFILSVIFAIWVRSIPPAIRDDAAAAAGDASSSSSPPPPPGDTSL
mmetsp:Transcript_36485/g.53445  ORF Transcript_36485/g.53445 Transcript_36485/m.53445 type:complete len:94 (+) Transcript_36485:289-570(+)